MRNRGFAGQEKCAARDDNRSAEGAMKKLKYQVSFTTPAFLGNAEQDGQWRTPPFKALLRQWWRVVYATDHGFRVNVADMRREEGKLFGHAWLDDDHNADGGKIAARKSLVRIWLDRWSPGALRKDNWPQNAVVTHPEVNRPVDSALYLGLGPLVRDKRATMLKTNAAIQEGETASLSIAVPDEHAPCVEQALMLMHRYGAVGGRSRNGWGSFSLVGVDESSKLSPLRLWRDALKLDWPHAIGQDERPLIWQTAPHKDWKALMQELATIKIGLRTQFKFTMGDQAPHPEDRHWLSYPVSGHLVKPWDKARLTNSLRLKIRPAPDDSGHVVGVIFHVPCLPPEKFKPDPRVIETIWRRVHLFLDAPAQKLSRILE